MGKKFLKWCLDNDTFLLLAGIALALRLFGNGFGLPDEFHIDETHYVPHAIRFGTGDLNPHWFFYPPLYMYALFVLYAVYFVIGRATGVFASAADFGTQYFLDPTAFYLIGRSLTAVLGVATVWLVYSMGRRAYGRAAGTAAAVMLTFCALHVEHSHYITADVPLTFMSALALWFAYQYAESGKIKHIAIAGACAGLAAALKYTGVLAAPACGIAVIYYWIKEKQKFSRAVIAAAAPALAAAAAFTVACPWWLLNSGPFWADVHATARNISGPWLGHENIHNMWTHVIFVFLREGMSWPLLLISVTGLVWAFRRRAAADWILAGFVLIFYLWVAHYQHYGFARYWVVILPMLCLLAGRLIADVVQAAPWLRAKDYQAAGVIALALSVATGWQAVRQVDELSQVSTRTMARRWMCMNVPPDTRVAMELHGPMIKGNRESIIDGADPNRYAGDRVAETMKFDKLNTGDRPWAKISITGKKHHFAAVEKTSCKYYVLNPFSLAQYPLEYYYREKYQYLIVNDGIYGRYLNAEKRFPKAVAFYHRLERECPEDAPHAPCELAAEFRPIPGKQTGPAIKIYRLGEPRNDMNGP